VPTDADTERRDAVLRMSEERISTPSIKALRDITVLETPLSSPISRGTSVNDSSVKDTPSKFATEKSLPPSPLAAVDQLNPPKLPVGIALYDLPMAEEVTPLPSPARLTPCRLASPVSSRSQSPSIRNLDRKSMVKQRIAALEYSTSRTDSPTTATEKSTRGRQIIRVLSESPTAGPKRSVLLRHGTITTIGGDSVASVSAEGTPRSVTAEARQLVSIPSGESLGTDANPWSVASRMTTPEPLRRSNISSVASHYSTDSTTPKCSSTAEQGLASKELPRLVIPQIGVHLGGPTDGETMVPSDTGRSGGETVLTTHSLSIFSPASPYSQRTVARDQAKSALNQLRDVEKTFLTISGIKSSVSPVSPPSSRPFSVRSLSHSRSPIDVSAVPHERTSIFSQASPLSEDAKLANPTLAAPIAQNHPESSDTGRKNENPMYSEPEAGKMSSQDQPCTTSDCCTLGTAISLSYPRQHDKEDVSPVHDPEAALLSRFAKVLPQLPSVADASSLQTVPSSLKASEHVRRKTNVNQASLSQLENKIERVHADLKTLPQQLRTLSIDKSLSPDTVSLEAQKLMRDINAGLKRIENNGDLHKEGLGDISSKLDTLLSQQEAENAISTVSGLPSLSGLPNATAIGSLHAIEIISKLEEIRNGFRADLPLLAQNLGELMVNYKSLEGNDGGQAALADAAPASTEATVPSIHADTEAIHSKLDEMLAIFQAKFSRSSSDGTVKEATHGEANTMVCKISFRRLGVGIYAIAFLVAAAST
jgi:hypothetical protein